MLHGRLTKRGARLPPGFEKKVIADTIGDGERGEGKLTSLGGGRGAGAGRKAAARGAATTGGAAAHGGV